MTVLPNNKLTNNGPGAMTFKLTATNGFFSGVVTLGLTSSVPFKGVLLQSNRVGRGFFGTNQAGRIHLAPENP